jgi:hypothetical protein
MEAAMYVVFAEELEDVARVGANIVPTLEEAFARIACRCGFSYRFVPGEEGWTLEMTDVERPERSPEPIRSSYMKPRDAQHDLMTQAVDGRIRGHVALHAEAFAKARIMRNGQGAQLHV